MGYVVPPLPPQRGPIPGRPGQQVGQDGWFALAKADVATVFARIGEGTMILVDAFGAFWSAFWGDDARDIIKDRPRPYLHGGSGCSPIGKVGPRPPRPTPPPPKVVVAIRDKSGETVVVSSPDDRPLWPDLYGEGR